MTNKVYIVGDSFVHGSGCLYGDPYRNLTGKRGKLFTTHLADELDVEEVNLGLHGASMEHILYQATSALSKVELGDYLVIMSTSVTRTNFVNEEEEWYYHFPEDTIWPINGQYCEDTYKYRLDVEDNIWNYYNTVFLNIIKAAEHLGARGLYLNSMDWFYEDNYHKAKSYFQTIKQETNGKIEDGHFSWLGHENFSKYVLDLLNNSTILIEKP